MPIQPKNMTRSARTQRYVSGLIDKSAGASVATCFATGRHGAKITGLSIIPVEDFADDCDIDVGYLVTTDEANNVMLVSADADAYIDGGTVLGATRNVPDAITDFDGGNLPAIHVLSIDVPPHTVVTMTHNAAGAGGTYYTVLEYESANEVPPTDQLA